MPGRSVYLGSFVEQNFEKKPSILLLIVEPEVNIPSFKKFSKVLVIFQYLSTNVHQYLFRYEKFKLYFVLSKDTEATNKEYKRYLHLTRYRVGTQEHILTPAS